MGNRELIYIGSITKAMRARDILAANGMNVYIERESDSFNKSGCGYSILIVNGTKVQAELILKKNGFKINGGNTGNA